MTKALSQTNMKQHYTMPAIVAAAAGAKPNSPRRRAEDIRISAPRYVPTHSLYSPSPHILPRCSFICCVVIWGGGAMTCRNFRNLKVGGLFGVPLEVAMKGYPEWQVSSLPPPLRFRSLVFIIYNLFIIN
jgi:hypothetical protein